MTINHSHNSFTKRIFYKLINSREYRQTHLQLFLLNIGTSAKPQQSFILETISYKQHNDSFCTTQCAVRESKQRYIRNTCKCVRRKCKGLSIYKHFTRKKYCHTYFWGFRLKEVFWDFYQTVGGKLDAVPNIFDRGHVDKKLM